MAFKGELEEELYEDKKVKEEEESEDRTNG